MVECLQIASVILMVVAGPSLLIAFAIIEQMRTSLPE